MKITVTSKRTALGLFRWEAHARSEYGYAYDIGITRRGAEQQAVRRLQRMETAGSQSRTREIETDR